MRMKIRTKLGAVLLIACLPWLAMAQNDDLYFVPKKEKKTEQKAQERQVTRQTTTTTTTTTTTSSVSPAPAVVVKDVTGKTRDIDEYNRRYTSRENTFSVENDTLYIEEKPYNERGEWVNGFEGSQDDYEYAMRIIRFRSPAYAIPISSPLYWDVVYGAFPSWDWNVYDDGLYAYVFPTFSNPLWWDWRWNWSIAGPRWGFGWNWYSPWYYSSWYSPYWYGGYWGGWYAGYWGGWHHPHPYWGGAGWRPHYSYNNRRGEIGMPRRNYSSARPIGASSSYRRSAYDRNGRTGGRVVSGSRNAASAIRGGRTTGYTRQSQLQNDNRGTYTRPSSTRTNSYRNTNAFNRMNNNNNSSRFNNVNRGSSNRGYSGGSSFGGSRNQSGGGATRSVGGGGGARRR